MPMNKQQGLKGKTPTIEFNRLAIVLKEEKITNRALANALGYEEATVSKWVNNVIQPPVSTFYRIALIIERDLKDLFVSSKGIDESEKEIHLRILAEMAEKGKRTGRKKS
jgi:transcriptional regulator with XRE-family HTH domain